ncbi:MAG TPA: hypothetical protein VK279_07075 [Solirubrobacteraceae bacterium]|nr:hypothetical protein [Solirubrobacteraceae bacterium]
MGRLALSLRCAALLGAGALAVHELRYALAGPAVSGTEGHDYMAAAGGVAVATLAVAIGLFLARVARPAPGERHAAPARARLWGAATAALLTIYAGQELAEGALSAARPDGPGALLAHGGWIAVPLAVLVGLLVAGALRGAQAVLARAAARRAAPLPRAPRRIRSRASATPPRRTRAAAAPAAGRAPPAPVAAS